MVKVIDDRKAIEVADKIWWVGFADYEVGFCNNPYLMIDGDEGILFDPGPGHPIFRDLIIGKIKQIINPEKIKYIIVHHQDPDLCGLIPLIENILHPDVTILCHSRAALFVPYYGTRKGILPICDEDVLRLKSGREIKFYHMPYMHFAGNMFSYDIDTASIFTSDIFGCFNHNWMLYSDGSYLEPARKFIEQYVSNREPLLYAYDKLKSLKIDRILPQHGAVIENDIDKFLELLVTSEPGGLLRELQNKATPEQEQEIVDAVRDLLSLKLQKEIAGDNLNELMHSVIYEGPAITSMLIDAVSNESLKMRVSNPLTRGRLHKAEEVKETTGAQLLNSLKKKYLSRQYGIMPETGSVEDFMKQSLKSFEANVVVMFIDIRGFTKWCSGKNPDVIMDTLSSQHGLVAKIINSNGGRVNKIIGDGMLAYFMEDYISESMQVADKIHSAIAEKQQLPIGIGMDFGKVIMGDMGEEARLDYTLIGSTVNLASRMCDSAAFGETSITMQFFGKLDNKLKAAILSLKSTKTINVQIKPGDPETEAIKFVSSELDMETFSK